MASNVTESTHCGGMSTQLKALKKTAAADGSLVVSALLGACLVVALVVQTAKVGRVNACARQYHCVADDALACSCFGDRVHWLRPRRCC